MFQRSKPKPIGGNNRGDGDGNDEVDPWKKINEFKPKSSTLKRFESSLKSGGGDGGKYKKTTKKKSNEISGGVSSSKLGVFETSQQQDLEKYRKLSNIHYSDSDDSDFEDNDTGERDRFSRSVDEEEEQDDFQMFLDDENDDENVNGMFKKKKYGGMVPVEYTKKEWLRKEVNYDDYKDGNGKMLPFYMQQMFSDYIIGNNNEKVNPDGEDRCPIVRFYGCTEDGHSAMCNVYGYTPYFYIKQNRDYTINDLNLFEEFLEQKVNSDLNIKEECKKKILKVESVEATDLMYYQAGKKSKFISISVAFPLIVTPLRKLLENGFYINVLNNKTKQIEFVYQKYQTYESNVLFVLRCMIDSSIVGSNWIQLNNYELIESEDRKRTNCQLECNIHYKDLVSMDTEKDPWGKIAPLRILSYDIECSNTDGHFPTPDKDSVIMIANYVTECGSNAPIIKNIFVLGTCAPIKDADVMCFETEEELLKAWRDFVIQSDPDIVTGYNIENFDTPYLVNRAKHLSVKGFNQLSRLKSYNSNVKVTTFSSKQLGSREIKVVNLPGRVTLDVLPAIKLGYKFSSYTLNNVSSIFLKEQKEDVHHTMITKLFLGNDNDRKRLAVYCLKDAYLPQRLMDKLMFIINYIEMARVTGIPISFILEKGQQIKVMSQLLRKTKALNYLIPTPVTKDNKTFPGANVFSPISGYYTKPVTTLDFASLYPSIMIANNLCYSSLIREEDLYLIPEDHYIRTPYGYCFMKSEYYQGVLTSILQGLLSKRKDVKKMMKTEKDPLRRTVLDGRQSALKVSANSVYGFTGASIGMLPCIPISASVTTLGKQMILQTKDAAEEYYSKKNGFSHDAKVLYGDTDSVMVLFGVDSIEESMKLGKEAADRISKLFKAPIKLEFEKVFCPYLLTDSKKRYAGLKYESMDKPPVLKVTGMENVRRDNCQLVRTVMNHTLELVIKQSNIEGAVQYIKNVISDLLANKIDIQMLIITKSISKSIQSYDGKVAHIELAKRMALRDPATAPRTGDRVRYVIIKTHKKAKAFEKSEDPIYVLENNIPLDNKYYLDNQLAKPLMRLLKYVVKSPETLLCGEHTRFIYNATPTLKTGIMKYAKEIPTCLRCRTPLGNIKSNGIENKTRTAVCDSCRPYMIDIYLDIQNERNHTEKKYSRAWTHCQNCQGSLHQEILCNNYDCSLFYLRRRIQLDLNAIQQKLSRFDVSKEEDDENEKMQLEEEEKIREERKEKKRKREEDIQLEKKRRRVDEKKKNECQDPITFADLIGEDSNVTLEDVDELE